MRIRSAQWFEVTAKYDKTGDNGLPKTETGKYVVDAFTCSEAETTVMEELGAEVVGDFIIKDIKTASFKEVCFTDGDTDDKWYKARLQYITLDEKSDKEKKTNVYYLIQAGSLQGAVKHIDEMMSTSMQTYSIAQVVETNIMDVYEHDYSSKKADDKPEFEQQ